MKKSKKAKRQTDLRTEAKCARLGKVVGCGHEGSEKPTRADAAPTRAAITPADMGVTPGAVQ